MSEGTPFEIAPSRGNVFADLGFEDPEDELARAKLVRVLADVIAGQRLSQAKVTVLGVDQPTVSGLLRGQTGGFGVDRLMRLLDALGQDVEISVRPKRGDEARVVVSIVHVV